MWAFITTKEMWKNIDRHRYTLAAHNICFSKQWHTTKRSRDDRVWLYLVQNLSSLLLDVVCLVYEDVEFISREWISVWRNLMKMDGFTCSQKDASLKFLFVSNGELDAWSWTAIIRH
ncbi:hypothetical protein ANCCAN_17574 [Ancylostoma caninum]|uniref:Uncharacterized protein n=1 Tax=Ancylostoma caninum TaxID=29170 RepID=A0A368FZV7_ANCCA|nr:hypothetical protein ANCCAN_17574 [Ancylostoma caninum]